MSKKNIDQNLDFCIKSSLPLLKYQVQSILSTANKEKFYIKTEV